MYFVEARAYLRQILRLLGIVSVGRLIRSSPDAMRKLLQFGALGLQQFLENPCLSDLSRGHRHRESACGAARSVIIHGFRRKAGGISGPR
jgi:hypothetical protein